MCGKNHVFFGFFFYILLIIRLGEGSRSFPSKSHLVKLFCSFIYLIYIYTQPARIRVWYLHRWLTLQKCYCQHPFAKKLPIFWIVLIGKVNCKLCTLHSVVIWVNEKSFLTDISKAYLTYLLTPTRCVIIIIIIIIEKRKTVMHYNLHLLCTANGCHIIML